MDDNGNDRCSVAKHPVTDGEGLRSGFTRCVVAIVKARSECDKDCGKLKGIESSARNVLTL
jgi:hypothetical protein